MALTKAELNSQLRAPMPGTRAFTRVAGVASLNLLPTLTGQGGSAYKRGGMEYIIAMEPVVQRRLNKEITKAYSRAQGVLSNIRTATFSFGDLRKHWVEITAKGGGTDRLLILTDTKSGQQGAMSIEFGRGEYELERKDGTKATIGEMTGKFILHRAFGVPPNSLHGTGGGDVT